MNKPMIDDDGPQGEELGGGEGGGAAHHPQGQAQGGQRGVRHAGMAHTLSWSQWHPPFRQSQAQYWKIYSHLNVSEKAIGIFKVLMEVFKKGIIILNVSILFFLVFFHVVLQYKKNLYFRIHMLFLLIANICETCQDILSYKTPRNISLEYLHFLWQVVQNHNFVKPQEKPHKMPIFN